MNTTILGIRVKSQQAEERLAKRLEREANRFDRSHLLDDSNEESVGELIQYFI